MTNDENVKIVEDAPSPENPTMQVPVEARDTETGETQPIKAEATGQSPVGERNPPSVAVDVSEKQGERATSTPADRVPDNKRAQAPTRK
jgi:hypothetical protein